MVEQMFEIPMNEPDKRSFQKARDYCKEWSAEHQAEVGVAEIALGAGLITWGLQSGYIHMGTDVVATKLSDSGLLGATAGAGIGGIGASILGSIGVVGMGTAFGIPALALIGGGAAIFGLAGYAAGDVAQKFLTPPAGFGDFFFGASILAVGVALMIDGARRVVTDQRVLQLASNIKDGVIQLANLTVEVVASTWEELQAIIKELANHPDAKNAVLGATTAATAATGTVLGGTFAASTVTLLGSHGLGALALTAGFVSAPVWPIIAGGAAGLAVGLAAWNGVQRLFSDDEPPTVQQGG